MEKQERWSRFIKESNKRSSIALGIAVMAIGYNMLPIEPSLEILWLGGIVLFFGGMWMIVSAASIK